MVANAQLMLAAFIAVPCYSLKAYADGDGESNETNLSEYIALPVLTMIFSRIDDISFIIENYAIEQSIELLTWNEFPFQNNVKTITCDK